MNTRRPRSLLRWGAGLTLVLLLMSGLPARAHDKGSGQRAVQEVSESNTSKDPQEPGKSNTAIDEGKRKQDLTRMLLLWFFRNHPLQ
jgi:hypothetical protein